MTTYLVTTAGGVTARVQGTKDSRDRIEREFALLLGEAVTVRKETDERHGLVPGIAISTRTSALC